MKDHSQFLLDCHYLDLHSVINNRQLADVTRDKEKCPLSALTGVCIKQVDFIDSLNNNFLSNTAFITKYNIKKNYLESYKVVFAIEKNVPLIKTSLLRKKPLKTCSLSRKFAKRFNRRSLSKEILSRQ